MPTLLGRELTTDEQAVEVALRATVEERRKTRDADVSFFETAASVPELLCPAAMSVLESDIEPSLRRWVYTQLIERAECLRQLIEPGHFTRQQLVDISRHLMTIDNFFDVKLAAMLPKPHSDQTHLEPACLLRILDVLDEISPGSRLILSLNHLTHHPDHHVASKAALVVGRRLQNKQWVTRQMASEDPRVRANVLEALWDVRTDAAREAFRGGLKDENNRVVGNALVGLHRMKEPGISGQVQLMLQDSRAPFRWTAAWAMGEIGDQELIPFLEAAIQDKEPKVGKAAQRALAAILNASPAEAGVAKPEPDPAAEATSAGSETPGMGAAAPETA